MVRCVTSDDPTGMVFQTGSRYTTVLYPVFHAQQQEIKLMTHIVDLIQKSSPTEAAGLNYECNMLHILITKLSAGGCSIHDDFSTLIGCLASDMEDNYKTSGGNLLPTQADQITFTVVWCTKAGPSCQIIWSHFGVDIGQVVTGTNDCHLQGPGTQSDGIKHRVVLCDRASINTNDTRIIISA